LFFFSLDTYSACTFTPIIDDGYNAANVPAVNITAKNIELIFAVTLIHSIFSNKHNYA